MTIKEIIIELKRFHNECEKWVSESILAEKKRILKKNIDNQKI